MKSLRVQSYRRDLLVSLAAVVVFGLCTKFYPGRGRSWINDAFGGIPYEIAWMLWLACLWPKVSARAIAGGVLLGTSVLEFLQLWQPPWLQAIRATLPGRLILGNTFVWSDFFYYALGCTLGWFGVCWLQRRNR